MRGETRKRVRGGEMERIKKVKGKERHQETRMRWREEAGCVERGGGDGGCEAVRM